MSATTTMTCPTSTVARARPVPARLARSAARGPVAARRFSTVARADASGETRNSESGIFMRQITEAEREEEVKYLAGMLKLWLDDEWSIQEPHAALGLQAAEKCVAVSPRKAPSVIKTNPPRTQKPVANAKAPAPPKAQAQSWRGPVSVCWMAAFLVALVAMTCAAFGSEDATSLASAAGSQSALHANTTGDLDVVACPPGIYFDPISDMANEGLL